MEKSKIGTVTSGMFFRTHIGEAESENGQKFQMSTAVSDGCPIVYCENTGKYFHISWEEILQLAIERGVSEEEEQNK